MGVTTARAAGVEEIAVCTPPGSGGEMDPVILAACALTGAGDVYRMGGAQGIAALAYGTETVKPVDVIVGPGNLYVQEAKRQVFGQVGIDGFAGPSDLLVIADGDSDPRLVALDLLAQAEHGPGTLVVLDLDLATICCERVAALLADAPETGAVAAVIAVEDHESALALAQAFAPEHLELVGTGAEALAPRATHAGCVFVGRALPPRRSATTSRALTTSCRPTAPLGSPRGSPRRISCAATPRCGSPIRTRWPQPRHRWRARRDSSSTPGRWRRASGTMMGDDSHRGNRPPDGRDRDPGQPDPGPRRHRRAAHRRGLPGSHARPARPPRPPRACSFTARGDLETGAHHTVEDVGICIGQALDQALGDRAGIVRYGHAVVPMDEARAACAIDISGRGLVRVRGRAAAGSDRELRPRAGGGVLPRAGQQRPKLTLHLTVEAGTNAHHMIEAMFKALARALRTATALDPDEQGVPSTKGTLV